jgi:hypothetical protein
MAMTDERTAERTLAERGKAVDAALSAIEKQFGRGAIMKLGSAERQAVDAIPTGSIAAWTCSTACSRLESRATASCGCRVAG